MYSTATKKAVWTDSAKRLVVWGASCQGSKVSKFREGNRDESQNREYGNDNIQIGVE